MLWDNVPVASRIEADVGAADHAQPVHQPNRRRAVGVLPQDVGCAVAVEIGGADGTRPRGAGGLWAIAAASVNRACCTVLRT